MFSVFSSLDAYAKLDTLEKIVNLNTFHAHRRHVKMEARADKPVTTRMNASVHQVSKIKKPIHIYSNSFLR